MVTNSTVTISYNKKKYLNKQTLNLDFTLELDFGLWTLDLDLDLDLDCDKCEMYRNS